MYPDEEEQLAQYLAVVRALRGLPITIRTMDLGADKGYAADGSGERLATNPALSLRAIRLCLRNTGAVRPQLRAILRASAEGPVRLMMPMLSSAGELNEALELIEDIRQELGHEGLAFDLTCRYRGYDRSAGGGPVRHAVRAQAGFPLPSAPTT